MIALDKLWSTNYLHNSIKGYSLGCIEIPNPVYNVLIQHENVAGKRKCLIKIKNNGSYTLKKGDV